MLTTSPIGFCDPPPQHEALPFRELLILYGHTEYFSTERQAQSVFGRPGVTDYKTWTFFSPGPILSFPSAGDAVLRVTLTDGVSAGRENRL